MKTDWKWGGVLAQMAWQHAEYSSLHNFFILAMNINGKLLVLKLSVKYNGPREWVSLSAVHAVLREEADFLFRKETEESPLNADLNSSMETVDLFARSVDFSNFGRYYFHIPLWYLATITGELDLSGLTTDKKGLRTLSKWCTDLYGLILKRCCNLDNEALCCLVDFSSFCFALTFLKMVLSIEKLWGFYYSQRWVVFTLLGRIFHSKMKWLLWMNFLATFHLWPFMLGTETEF